MVFVFLISVNILFVWQSDNSKKVIFASITCVFLNFLKNKFGGVGKIRQLLLQHNSNAARNTVGNCTH